MVAVTETLFNVDIDDDLVLIKGYNLFRKDRSNRRGEGVCVYLSSFSTLSAALTSKMIILSVCGYGFLPT